MRNIRGVVVAAVVAAVLAGCGGAEDGAAVEVDDPTTTTEAPEPEEIEETDAVADLAGLGGDVDALADAVAEAIGRSDVAAAGASLGPFATWLPAPDDAAVFDVSLAFKPAITGDPDADELVLSSRVGMSYATKEGPDTLRPLYEDAFAGEGWEPAGAGWRSSEDDRGSFVTASYHTAEERYDGPSVDVEVMAWNDEPDVRRVELTYLDEMTEDEVTGSRAEDVGNLSALLHGDLPVPDGYEMKGGSVMINPVGPRVGIDLTWMRKGTPDLAADTEEVVAGLSGGGWSPTGEQKPILENMIEVAVERTGWLHGRVTVSDHDTGDETTMVSLNADWPFGDAALEAPAEAPTSESRPESGSGSGATT